MDPVQEVIADISRKYDNMVIRSNVPVVASVSNVFPEIRLNGCDMHSCNIVLDALAKVYSLFPYLVAYLQRIICTNISIHDNADRSGTTADEIIAGYSANKRSIYLNKKFFKSYDELAQCVNRSFSIGFHPFGISVHSILIHEFGHTLDDYLTNVCHVYGDESVSLHLLEEILDDLGIDFFDMKNCVSQYATYSHEEWFAECFAECLDSPSPRTIACEFWNRLNYILHNIQIQ